jgi:hypothetical protein
MEKQYTIIEFLIGTDVGEAVSELISYTVSHKGELACGEFNGHKLYSDTVSLDSAYQLVTGKSYYEFHENQRLWHKEYDRKEEEYKSQIPALTEMWIAKGHKILEKYEWDRWDEIVPIRLNDLYHGMELGNCLDIIEILNNKGSLDDAKKKIVNQGHSGMSFNLVCAMVKEFCDRGEEFVQFVR